jgi:ABC-type Zn uptake system ZnuABC Zn-binding protein ZnuA
VVLAVKQIAINLSELDPDGTEVYMENAEAYTRELVDLHQWTLDQLKSIGAERRKLVTAHDAFGYFAELYNFRVVTVLISGGSTHKEPTATDLVEIIKVIKEEGIPVIFLETTTDSKIAELIARETNARVENGLHVGSLGEQGSGAETYIEMFRHNVKLITTALAAQ